MIPTNRIRNNLGNRAKLSNQASNAMRKVANTGQAIKSKVSNAAQSISDTVKDKVADVQKKVSNIGETPGISKLGTMTQEFFSANTAISNFVMFILCLLLFVILFQIGSGIIYYFFGPQYNPYILNGMVPSNVKTVISANPNVIESVPIFRSVNQAQGIEFSWNVWFNVQDASAIDNTKGGALIFSKGTNNSSTLSGGNKYLNVSPGLFLTTGANENNLVVVLNTFNPSNSPDTTYNETIVVPNIPMQKWVCCTIRVQGTYVDVYINGILTKRTILINIPKQNYYDTYVGDASTSAFKGYISSLRYYAKAINYDEIQALFAAGPSLKMLKSDTMPLSNDFLSMNWYYKYKYLPPPNS